MTKNHLRILILESDPSFCEHLKVTCGEFGKTTVAHDLSTALDAITQDPFQLLLINGHLSAEDNFTLNTALEDFQPEAKRLSLFTSPDLASVINAMKGGAYDILWAAMDKSTLKAKVREAIALERRPRNNFSLTQLAESLTEKAMDQKTTLFSARKEFSRIFLKQILWQQKLRRTQLADLMQVSPRTLHRHLSA